MIDPSQTRGFLNCNPGNLDRSEPPWNGEIRDVAQCVNDVQRMELTNGRFCVFTDAVHGFRALAKNLQAYRDRLGLYTIDRIIDRHAPPNENNTMAYKDRVVNETGIGRFDMIKDDDWPRVRPAIMRAITDVELGGFPYQNDELEQGNALAG